jgi:hypothetical protein
MAGVLPAEITNLVNWGEFEKKKWDFCVRFSSSSSSSGVDTC